jgi:hypothetical protein
MSNIIYFLDHLDGFKRIEPLIREVCTSAGITNAMTSEVIDEYKVHFELLSSMSTEHEQLNHACHIILGLLIKAKL